MHFKSQWLKVIGIPYASVAGESLVWGLGQLVAKAVALEIFFDYVPNTWAWPSGAW